MLDMTEERYLPWMTDPVIAYEHLHRYAVAAELAAGKRVLDLASGEGYGSAMLAERAASVTGVELNESAVHHASSKYTRGNLRYLRGSMIDVPVPGVAQFDLVTCFEALEHVREQDDLMREVKRLLAPGGVLLVSTPNRLISDETHHDNHFHLRELYFDEFKQLVGQYFAHAVYLGQGVYSTSVLWDVAGTAPDKQLPLFIKPAEEGFTFSRDERKPSYFIAVASDDPAAVQRVASTMTDVTDARYTRIRKLTDELSKGMEEARGLIGRQQEVMDAREAQVATLEERLRSAPGTGSADVEVLRQQLAEKDAQLVRANRLLDVLRRSPLYPVYRAARRVRRMFS